MPLDRILKNQLVSAGLLPKSVSGIKSFDDLSAALIRKNRKKHNFISFDPDLDPNPQTYEDLLKLFLDISNLTETLTERDISVQDSGDEYQLTLITDATPMSCSWNQGTSTISGEFIEFVELFINNENGRLLRLNKDDALSYLYLDTNLAYAIEEWRDNPSVERWSYWENIPHWRQSLEQDHPILPLEKFNQVCDEFSNSLLSNGSDPFDSSSYNISSIKLPYLREASLELVDDDFPEGLGPYLETYDLYYPGLEDWVPDESCYVVILDSPAKIIFEATPGKAEKIRGEMSDHKSILYIDKSYKWSICLTREDLLSGVYTPANSAIIIAGNMIIDKISDRIKTHRASRPK